jgi:hypothetical protein
MPPVVYYYYCSVFMKVMKGSNENTDTINKNDRGSSLK